MSYQLVKNVNVVGVNTAEDLTDDEWKAAVAAGYIDPTGETGLGHPAVGKPSDANYLPAVEAAFKTV